MKLKIGKFCEIEPCSRILSAKFVSIGVRFKFNPRYRELKSECFLNCKRLRYDALELL